MIASTSDCRWHAYADGQDAGIHPSQSAAHAAARSRHEQHVRESQEPETIPTAKKKRTKK